MGRKTWDEMNPNWLPFQQGDGTYLIFTRNSNLVSENPKTIYHLGTPEEAVELLKNRGHSQLLVIGGGETYGRFLHTGLVDELYVDIEPWLFGQGTPFFPENNFELNFKLIETIKLTSDVIQLHYQVVK
jgi:dihydrofolate reductase